MFLYSIDVFDRHLPGVMYRPPITQIPALQGLAQNDKVHTDYLS